MRYLTVLLLMTTISCRPETRVAMPEPKRETSKPQIIPVPAAAIAKASVPFVASDGEGGFLVSFIEDGAFRFVAYRHGTWSDTREIARGDLLVNRADFPSIAAKGKSIIAQWSTHNQHGSIVNVARSEDGGMSWSKPRTPHPLVVSQFGFVSLLPTGEFVWLDGRKLKGGMEGEGEMELRASGDVPLDTRVCDCCQTAMAMTSAGPIAAYRDRSPGEVRDISMVRYGADGWTSPKTLHADGWKIAGCPVNGPQLDADGTRVVAAWFTAANDQPRVQLAFSDDSGQAFSAPVRIDSSQTIGHVDVALLSDGAAAVTWIESGKLHIRRVGRDGTTGDALELGEASGFPHLAVSKENVAIVWSAPDGNHFVTVERL